MPIPELVAHRGYAAQYPENTLPGIEAAIAAGAHYIEIDVQLSADHVPVLFHDRTLERVCGVPGSIHEFSLAHLNTLYASEYGRFGYRYPNMRLANLAQVVELLVRHTGVRLFVEIKRVTLSHHGIQTVLDTVRHVLQPIEHRAILISFSYDFLLAARQQSFPVLGAILEDWGHRMLDVVRAVNPEYLFCDVEALPRWGRFDTRGAQLVVYEVTDADQALRLAQRGASLIETFAIGELRQQIELRHSLQ